MLDFSVTFIITIVNIAILCFILRAILFKRVTKFMTARTERIKNEMDKIAEDRKEAQRVLNDCQKIIKEAELKAAAILQEANKNAQDASARIVAEGQEKARALIEDALGQIEMERQQVLAQFKQDAVTLVMAASSRLLQKNISGDDNDQYSKILLKELAANAKGVHLK